MALDGLLQRVGHGLEAALELAVLLGPADVVEHREQRAQHRGLARGAGERTVALDASLVVDVLGLQPLEVGRALGELLLDGRVPRLGSVVR